MVQAKKQKNGLIKAKREVFKEYAKRDNLSLQTLMVKWGVNPSDGCNYLNCVKEPSKQFIKTSMKNTGWGFDALFMFDPNA